MIRVHGVHGSPFVRKVFIALDFKGIPYETRSLERAYPEPALYPSDIADNAMADWYEELCGNQVSELATGIFFQRFMRPFAFKQEPDGLRHD